MEPRRLRRLGAASAVFVETPAEHLAPAHVVALAHLEALFAQELPAAVLEHHAAPASRRGEADLDGARRLGLAPGVEGERDAVRRIPHPDGSPGVTRTLGIDLVELSAHPRIDRAATRSLGED